ncbi:MAG TPA: maleylpyruvate isomerase family mycothiol-dependent enzyme [Streptosporangiaceae bacterium]|nr:maleylpyruvate isomerase family mycothiol-dependent enzyme [Streptosporangiaceae bacterium]
MMDLISAERRELADVLGGLSAEQWRSPSLCAGWTTAHVVAHLTMPFRITEEEFGRGMAEARGDFTTFSDAVAARDSELPQAELVGVLRDNIANPWAPPGGGQQGAMSHDLIHGLDITWPLSITYPVPDQAMATVLGLAAGQGGQNAFGVDTGGIELRAIDLDWSSGSGAQATGPSRDLLLLLARRSLAHDAVTGPGAQRLRDAAR